jgi:hypothetical protein
MANATIATPTVLVEPGVLYWAPIGSAEPTAVSTASAFSDSWPVAWIPLGMTDAGSDFDVTLTTAPIVSAESIDPIAYRTTDRAAVVKFMLMNYTATNLARAFNGAATTVTGSGATTITKLDPPVPGTETRCMLGWESLDSTVRFVARQVINSGTITMAFHKSPSHTAIAWNGQLEKPITVQPWSFWTAGVARA